MITGILKLRSHLTLSITAILLSGGLAIAQSSNPEWTNKLSQQLAVDEGCEVAYFTTLVETKKEGQNFYAARSHCVDGRQFDGERLGDEGPFEIKACKVVVC